MASKTAKAKKQESKKQSPVTRKAHTELCELDQLIWAVIGSGKCQLTGVSYGEANTYIKQSGDDSSAIVTGYAASRLI